MSKRSSKKANRFYSSKDWHKARSVANKLWKAAGRPPCGICGKPILHNERTVVDHIQPYKLRPDLAYDQANLRVVHHGCNSGHAAKYKAKDIPQIGVDGYAIEEPSTDGVPLPSGETLIPHR